MGHEAIIYGMIEGAPYKTGDQYTLLQQKNEDVIRALPEEDEWPWLTRSMFALPASWPQGTYRSQIIHFGASLKDNPFDRTCWDLWLDKFERLLRRLWWYGAAVHLITDFEPDRCFFWLPTREAMLRMVAEDLHPISDWDRSVVEIKPEPPPTSL